MIQPNSSSQPVSNGLGALTMGRQALPGEGGDEGAVFSGLFAEMMSRVEGGKSLDIATQQKTIDASQMTKLPSPESLGAMSALLPLPLSMSKLYANSGVMGESVAPAALASEGEISLPLGEDVLQTPMNLNGFAEGIIQTASPDETTGVLASGIASLAEGTANFVAGKNVSEAELGKQNLATGTMATANSDAANIALTSEGVDQNAQVDSALLGTSGAEPQAATKSNKPTAIDAAVETTRPATIKPFNSTLDQLVTQDSGKDFTAVEDVTHLQAQAGMSAQGLSNATGETALNKVDPSVKPDEGDAQATGQNLVNEISAPVETVNDAVPLAGQLPGDGVVNNQNLASITTSNNSNAQNPGTPNSINPNAGQAGQQSQSGNQQSGQSGQPGQQQSGANFEFMQQQQMAQHRAQDAQLKENSFVDMITAERLKAEKTVEAEKLASEINLSPDRKQQLPLGLQSITQPVRHPQWGQALGQRVVYMANSQVQEAKIMLNPEKLGPVQVKLQLDKDQQIHVSMTAQHAITREAMENALPKLKEMLDSAGIQYASVDVSEERNFDQSQQDGDKARSANTNQNAASDQNATMNEPMVQKQSDNLVDYYA